MPTLSPGDWMTLLGMAVTAVSAFVAVREQTKGLKEGQTETLRLVGALHKRLDHYGEEITRIDKDHVRLDERVKALRESQRFHLRRAAAAGAAADQQQDMFVIAEDDRGE